MSRPCLGLSQKQMSVTLIGNILQLMHFHAILSMRACCRTGQQYLKLEQDLKLEASGKISWNFPMNMLDDYNYTICEISFS